MYSQYKRFTTLLFFSVILFLSGAQAIPTSAGRLVFVQSPAPGTFSEADLRKLRWIEGTWRGRASRLDLPQDFDRSLWNTESTFERFRFENDRTLVVERLSGDKLEKAVELARFELRDGKFGVGSQGRRWEASSIDDKSVNFVPVTKGLHSIRFRRESESSFITTTVYPAGPLGPARQEIRFMERWPKR